MVHKSRVSLLFVFLGCLAAAAPYLRGAGLAARAFLTGTTVNGFPQKCDMRVDLSGDQEMLFITPRLTLHVAYERVNTLEYGQHVGRRYAEAILLSPLFMLAKSRKHYLTVGYTDGHGRQQAVIFEVNKGDIRALLAEMEARTGRRIEYTDDEARASRG